MSIPADLIERARAADILEVAQRYSALKRITATEWAGPCPVCAGFDRFAINTRKQIWSCRYCPRGQGKKSKGGGVIDLVQHAEDVTFVEAVERLAGKEWAAPTVTRKAARKLDDEADRLKGIADAVSLWAASGDPRGSPVETYLKTRDLNLSDDTARTVLRWHSGLGAMIALFRNIETNKPQAISRTFLGRDGRKIERKFLGPVGGAAVMLDAGEDVLGALHVCEGVETGLAARQLGLRPTWALGSAGAVAGFHVLGGVECLTLLQENDAASPRACDACAARWHAAGREVILNKPTVGKDLNDALRAIGGAR